MQPFGLQPSKTGQVDWNAARNSDTIKKVSPSSIPMNHGWMWLRQHGAKRSMRKYLALNCRRRPSLDPLESRYLLSGGIEVIEVHPAPALIIGIDLRQTPLPVNGFGSLAISSVSSGPGDWPMPGFHHDFSPTGELSTPAVEFHTYSDPQVVSPWISPFSESENAAVSTPNSGKHGGRPRPSEPWRCSSRFSASTRPAATLHCSWVGTLGEFCMLRVIFRPDPPWMR